MAGEVSDHFLLVMRAYFEKPRTVLGWKGFLYDPWLDNSNDIEKGLMLTRQFLLELLELEIPGQLSFWSLPPAPILMILFPGVVLERALPLHKRTAKWLPACLCLSLLKIQQKAM